jgi:HK97 family phage prohead protease
MDKTSDYPLLVKNIETDGSFSGYASVFGVIDSQGEEVAPGAFDASLKSWQQSGKMPKLLWQHDCRKPIGMWREIREDTHGLFVKGQLLLDIAQGREAYSLLKNGIVDGLSIGFLTVRARRSGSSQNRILEEIALHEISLVTFAANQHAKVDRVKMVDPELDALLHRLDQLGRALCVQKPEIRFRDKQP